MTPDMTPALLVTCAIPPELQSVLSAEFTLVTDLPEGMSAEVAVTTSMAGFTEAQMAALPGLKLILCNGTGLEKIDLAAAEARGIRVVNTPDAVTEDTADTAIALTYALLRRTVAADRFVREGRWGPERFGPGRRIKGTRLGVVGLGRIGRRVAERASALEMEVRYHARSEKPGPWGRASSLSELAAWADVLVVTVAGGAETAGLIDAGILSALGPEGWLINIARGSVVDEEALITALQSGTIAGAGLDVFAREPQIDPRFATLETCILQPHSAAITRETRGDIAGTLLEAARAFYGRA